MVPIFLSKKPKTLTKKDLGASIKILFKEFEEKQVLLLVLACCILRVYINVLKFGPIIKSKKLSTHGEMIDCRICMNMEVGLFLFLG